MPTQLPLWSVETEDAHDSRAGAATGHRAQRVYPAESFPQLLKWIGNKHRYATEIASYFPKEFGAYYEPFLGSGAVLGTIAPKAGVGSDVFGPLMEIWTELKRSPEQLVNWYADRWRLMKDGNKVEAYEQIKAAYNRRPNGADLVFLARACYGGVVRFRRADGYMSTPCGPHEPISPHSFERRVNIWAKRIQGVEFRHAPFDSVVETAKAGDLVYCDPPYTFTQTILYGAQNFSLPLLLEVISSLKKRGVYIALSIDGTKKSGDTICNMPIPVGLFEREVLINCGRSMLKRFQMRDKSLEREVVADRLMLTY